MYNFCNVGLKISGVSPIVSYSLFDFENESITSVTAAITGPHTLAFLGTTNGWIKKVLISGPDPGEYESIEIDPGNAILTDTMMSPKQDYLYVLSKHKVGKQHKFSFNFPTLFRSFENVFAYPRPFAWYFFFVVVFVMCDPNTENCFIKYSDYKIACGALQHLHKLFELFGITRSILWLVFIGEKMYHS